MEKTLKVVMGVFISFAIFAAIGIAVAVGIETTPSNNNTSEVVEAVVPK